MSGRSESRVDMTTGAVTPRLVALAWPLVAGNLLQTAYNLADMFWVGRVGPKAVAAVSLMFPTAWLFVSTAMGITAAAVALVSQHVGAGRERAADHVVGQTVLLAVAAAAALAVGGYLVRRPLLSLVGADGRVYDLSLQYVEVIFLTIPFTFLFFAFRAVLRAAGDTRTAMWLVVVSAGVNVVLDPLVVLGWGPFPALGVRGAALATLFSRVLAAGAGVYVLLDGGWGVRLRPADLRPDLPVLQRLVGVGYPATIDGLLRSLSAVVMAALVARFGDVATAAYGIVIRLLSVSWTVSGAVGQAAATGVGQNLGARTPDRAAEVTWKATGGTMAVLFGAGALLYAVPAVAVRVFVGDEAVVAAGVSYLRIVAPFVAFFGGLMVLQGAFRGAGDTRVAMLLSLLSRWFLRVPIAVVLAFAWAVPVGGLTLRGLAWGAPGVWWAWAAASVGSLAVGAAWFRRGRWREGVVGEEGAAGETADRPGEEPEGGVRT